MKSITEIFEDQALVTPDNIALSFNGRTLTYAELNARANQVAWMLRERYAIWAEDRVGVMIGRNEMMVVAILAILKSGAAYVPIDPTYPEERISYLLNDAAVRLVVVSEPAGNELCRRNYFDTIDVSEPSLLVGMAGDNLPVIHTVHHLAYIIYTSGSTGNPKGVMVEHRNVVSLLFGNNNFDFNSADVWTLFHSVSFDFSVWEIFAALLSGGKLVVVPRAAVLDSRKFVSLLLDEKVTVLNQVPSIFYLTQAEIFLSSDALRHQLRYVIFGGEALNMAMLARWLQTYPHVHMVNMYGITETTVHVTYKEITMQDVQIGASNIGKPLRTHTIYLLCDDGSLASPDEVGEIAVAGPCVSRGYWRRDTLTRDRFIRNPRNESERLYLSGDLAKFTTGGDLIYLCRKDNQIKLHGYRIELGEIERVILQLKSVHQVSVLVKGEGSDQVLIAYLKADGSSENEVRNHCKLFLPAFMVPSHFRMIPDFPLTSNGKVDRRSLLEI